MNIRGKIFLQFFSSWTLMPFALLFAQATGIAQKPEFVTLVLVITSIAPIQIYVNEIFAPAAVRYNQKLCSSKILEIFFAVSVVIGFLMIRLRIEFPIGLVIGILAQGYVFFSYLAARRVLEYQADSVIGGRYSYLIGAIVPIGFLLILLCFWSASLAWKVNDSLLYALIILPNFLQHLYLRIGWMSSKRIGLSISSNGCKNFNMRINFVLLIISMIMSIVAQHWKIELAQAAISFAAVSIYLISPVTSLWLIFSKSKYMTQIGNVKHNSFIFWASPLIVGSTLLISGHNPLSIFLLALLTQLYTFKFITDIRSRNVPIN